MPSLVHVITRTGTGHSDCFATGAGGGGGTGARTTGCAQLARTRTIQVRMEVRTEYLLLGCDTFALDLAAMLDPVRAVARRDEVDDRCEHEWPGVVLREVVEVAGR